MTEKCLMLNLNSSKSNEKIEDIPEPNKNEFPPSPKNMNLNTTSTTIPIKKELLSDNKTNNSLNENNRNNNNNNSFSEYIMENNTKSDNNNIIITNEINNLKFNIDDNSIDIPITKIKVNNHCDDDIDIVKKNNFEIKTKKIEPWEYAENFPDSIIKGTLVRVYPFPNDITKEEIYDNFKVLGEIIDIDIFPLNKNKKLKNENSKNSYNGKNSSNKSENKNENLDFSECIIRFKELENVEKIVKLTNAKFDVCF